LPFCHDIVISGRRVRMLHASPQGVFHRVSYRHTPEQYARMFLNTTQTGDGAAPSCVLLRRHPRHVPRGRRQPDLRQRRQRREPARRDDRVVVLEGVLDKAEPAPFGIQFVRVPCDTEQEIAVAEASGMPEATA
jgi:hypothetical protein